ncbi:MAG TPA: ABC transporter permease [Casimicrobiaceae bacterium]|nr:ABC transporter permease [Casimicrobiaceae bacterium]
MTRTAVRWLKGSVSIAAVVSIWWMVTDGMHLFTPLVLPSPLTVVKSAWDLIFDPELQLFSGGIYNGNLIGHALVSTGRVALGFAMGVMVAVPLGVLIARSAALEPYVDPLLQILRPIPPIAWTPLAILWFGLGLKGIVFLIFLGAFWPMLLNTISGVREVPPILGRAAYSLGASRRQVLFTVVLPAAIPFLFTGLRLSFGSAWITIVAAELIAASEGLGYLIMNARRILAAPDIIVGMLTIGLLGLAFDRLFRSLERRLYAR